MTIHYVTFGKGHTHRIGDITFDADCVAVFEAKTPQEGRLIALDLFGPKFCFECHGDQFPQESMRYYPRGQIVVPGLYIEKGLADPAAQYAPHNTMSLFEEYTDLPPNLSEHMSRLRHKIEGMSPSHNKSLCQKALEEIHQALLN